MRGLDVAILFDSDDSGHRHSDIKNAVIRSGYNPRHLRNANETADLSTNSVLIVVHPTWAIFDSMCRGLVVVTNQKNRFLWHMNNFVHIDSIEDVSSVLRQLESNSQLVSLIRKQAQSVKRRCGRRKFAESFLPKGQKSSTPSPAQAVEAYSNGVAEMSGGRFKNALRHFDDALRILGTRRRMGSFSRADTLHRMALCHEKLGSAHAALQAVDSLLNIEPEFVGAALTKMRALVALGDRDAAMRVFRQSVPGLGGVPKEMKQIAASILAADGDARKKRGDLTGAGAAYMEAYKLDPSVKIYSERWNRLKDRIPHSPTLQKPRACLDVPTDVEVSIVMPCYNDEDVLAESVSSVLRQTLSDFELLLVNDGSIDGTELILSEIKDKRVMVVHKRNGGPSSARNVGLRLMSSSKHVAFLDSDDLWEPDFLETMVCALRKAPAQYGLSYCNSEVSYDGVFQNVMDFDYKWPAFIKSWGMIPTGTFVVRREAVEAVGPFNEEIDKGEDLEWLWRVALYHDFLHVDKTLHYYRRSSSGQLATATDSNQLLASFRNKYLDIRGVNHGVVDPLAYSSNWRIGSQVLQ